MAEAVRQDKTKSAKRTSHRKKNPKAIPPNCQVIDDVFFRRWRNLFGSERALQHLEDLLRSKPSWHVSASGKVTHVDPGYWQRATLSVKTDADGVDRLAVRYTPYVHDPDYSQYNGRFFLRTVDIIECEERLGGSNNVLSDYDPIAEFEREIEGRPRTPQRLAPTTPPPPSKEPAPKKKRRKAKQPSPPASSTATDQQPKDEAGPDRPSAAVGSEPPKRVNTKEWIMAEAKRLKKANEIPPNAYQHPTDFAKLLEEHMRTAAETNKSIRLVGWRYIKNHLSEWGLWPIESIKIA